MLGGNGADGVVFVFTVNKCAVAADDADTNVAPVNHKHGLVMFVTPLEIVRVIHSSQIGGR